MQPVPFSATEPTPSQGLRQRWVGCLTGLVAWLLLCPNAPGQSDFLKRLGIGGAGSTASGAAVAALDDSQVVNGLKEALANGVQHAVTNLGRSDGFLKDLDVKILLPSSLKKAERSLRFLGQDRLVDNFVSTMNRAAEQAAPQAAEVLGGAIRQMSVADAKSILQGTNNAATQYFRRTSETNLYARFLPIVQQATATAGVTSAYKEMVGRVGSVANLVGGDNLDLDGYVTRKALDGLFLKMAQEEKRIRENPLARTTDVLKKVFGAVGGKP